MEEISTHATTPRFPRIPPVPEINDDLNIQSCRDIFENGQKASWTKLQFRGEVQRITGLSFKTPERQQKCLISKRNFEMDRKTLRDYFFTYKDQLNVTEEMKEMLIWLFSFYDDGVENLYEKYVNGELLSLSFLQKTLVSLRQYGTNDITDLLINYRNLEDKSNLRTFITIWEPKFDAKKAKDTESRPFLFSKTERWGVRKAFGFKSASERGEYIAQFNAYVEHFIQLAIQKRKNLFANLLLFAYKQPWSYAYYLDGHLISFENLQELITEDCDPEIERLMQKEYNEIHEIESTPDNVYKLLGVNLNKIFRRYHTQSPFLSMYFDFDSSERFDKPNFDFWAKRLVEYIDLYDVVSATESQKMLVFVASQYKEDKRPFEKYRRREMMSLSGLRFFKMEVDEYDKKDKKYILSKLDPLNTVKRVFEEWKILKSGEQETFLDHVKNLIEKNNDEGGRRTKRKRTLKKQKRKRKRHMLKKSTIKR